jgi:hypothetical protein
MMDAVPMKDNYQKRKEAMKKRLASLGKGNPVVAKAVKAQEPPEEDKKWKDWQIVDELVSAARREYMDEKGKSMNECVSNLANALSKLASKKGLDTRSKKHNNEDIDEDY